MKTKNLFIKILFSSFAFAYCNIFAGEVGRLDINFTVVDEQMKPVAGATVSGDFNKGITSGFFSSELTEEIESVKCTTNDNGVCKISAPLTINGIGKWVELKGQMVSVHLPSASSVEFKGRKGFGLSDADRLKNYQRRIYIEGDKARLGGGRALVPMNEIKKKLSITDDDLETEIKIDTQGTRALWANDNEISDIAFIRAWINKKNGNRRFQIYSHVDYDDQEWRFYSTVNYQTPSGPKSELLDKIVSKPYYFYGNKMRRWEDVGFEIPESILREISKNYIDGSDAELKYRLFSKSGEKTDFVIPMFEIAGLLSKIDDLIKK